MIIHKRFLFNLLKFQNSSLKSCLTSRRAILSAAYECHEDWKNRLNSPLLSNVKTLEFMTKLKEKYDENKRIDSVDVDILANKLEDLESHQLDFAEELFYNFRHSEDAINVIDSMPHALLRNLMQRGEDDRIFRMLKDKVHYGIFLDDFSAKLLFNYFIKKNDFAGAAEIAYDLMHQEDLGNELTQSLALFAVYSRILQLPLNAEPRVLSNQAEMEVKYRKVPFIPNLWYDGHFDLPNEHAKLGRTLEMLFWNNSNSVLRSLEIVGLGLGLKFHEALRRIEDILNEPKDVKLINELIEHFERMLSDLKTCEKTPDIEPGLLRMIHLYPYVTEEQKTSFLETFQDLKTRLISANILINASVMDDIKARLNLAIEKHQTEDIQNHKKLYHDWIKRREQLIQKQIYDHHLKTSKQNIAERLVELTRTEEKLRFFEETASIEMALDEARKMKEKQVDLKLKEEEEVFVLPPGERKSSGDAAKKRKK